MIDFRPIVPPGQVRRDGIVKVKLAHGQDFSLLLLDRVYVDEDGRWLFFEPSMFGPPRLAFHDADALAQVWLDTPSGDTLHVSFTDGDLAGRLPDGSQLFACSVVGLADFPTRHSGDARRAADGSFELRLFHHTRPETLPLIVSSGHVRGSPWNLQGNKRLENVGYAYLTNLPAITSDDDLAAVAMATDELFGLRLDDAASADDVVIIKVTRSATTDRSATLALWVPDHMIASAHLIRHDQRDVMGVFYEAVLPAVFRIGLQPGCALDFLSETATPPFTYLQRFDYVIVGDARTRTGIVAPYDEENTTSICKVEFVEHDDVVSFWRANADTDRFSGRDFDPQVFAGLA
ncbi:hypothetical protein K7957_00140 [Sphingomonas yunnanensis]|uniref:hypothetical protein n=1 Tax=Sphingomonas yunnanensis TaxID=310400 RepID=UPI001CA679AF|nr:hypothetical protein [Sphingomonas yunnanensis]MBY9061341.1 hypothetical protein [Sphingomonas yunnanensis]